MVDRSEATWSSADLRAAIRAIAARPPPGDRSATGRLLVFLPGFLVSPASYRSLLGAVATGAATTVVVPQLYRRGPSVLAGRFSADDEADTARRVVDELGDHLEPDELWLGGHSRGGQAAWIAAGTLDPAGLVVIDPVDGAGRHPSRLHAAANAATFGSRALVVGAGHGERCAPAAVNHEHFARAAPTGSVHVVVDAMGHGDVLDDRAAGTARRLCGGSDRASGERATVAAVVSAFIAGSLADLGATPTTFTRR